MRFRAIEADICLFQKFQENGTVVPPVERHAPEVNQHQYRLRCN